MCSETTQDENIMSDSLKHGLVLILTIALLSFAQTGGASGLSRILDRGTLIVGTSANMPPMSFVGPDGNATGFDVDLARFIAQAMNVKLEKRVLPFVELLPALEQGEVDMIISNMTITPERNLRVAFAGPYLVSGKCVVTKDKVLARGSGTDLNTSEIKVAVLAGSTSESFVRELLPQATVVTVDDYDDAVAQVRQDEASGLLTDYPICKALLKANPDAGFISLFSLLTYEPIGIALPPNDAHFLNFTENLLERLEKTEVIDQLGKLWFGNTGPAPAHPTAKRRD
jgi:ABC-type amino acid transport substrate-binding protein